MPTETGIPAESMKASSMTPQGPQASTVLIMAVRNSVIWCKQFPQITSGNDLRSL